MIFGIYSGKRLAFYVVLAIVIAVAIGFTTYTFVKMMMG
jgi:hypothetical protein